MLLTGIIVMMKIPYVDALAPRLQSQQSETLFNQVRTLLQQIQERGYVQVDIAGAIGYVVSPSTISRILQGKLVGQETLKILMQILPKLLSQDLPQRRRKKRGRQPGVQREGESMDPMIQQIYSKVEKLLIQKVELEHYTIGAIAGKLGIAPATIRRILSGKNVKLATLQNLLDQLPKLPPKTMNEKRSGPHGARISPLEMDTLTEQIREMVEAEDYPVSQRKIANLTGLAPREIYLILHGKITVGDTIQEKLREALSRLREIIERVRLLEPQFKTLLQADEISEEIQKGFLRDLVERLIKEEIQRVKKFEDLLSVTLELSRSL